jgi:hypothetical protein
VLVGDSSPDLGKVDESLIDLANVRFVVQHSSRSQGIPESFEWGLIRQESDVRRLEGAPLGDSHSYAVFENSDALPRAFVVGQTRVLSKSPDPIAALGELQPRSESLMSTEFLPPGVRADFAPATIVTYTPNRVVVEADLTAPGYLVLADTWYPGWTAIDNGRPTSVIPASVAFRAVPLAPGQHRVEFEYRPIGLRWAAIISFIGWLAAVGITCLAIRSTWGAPWGSDRSVRT